MRCGRPSAKVEVAPEAGSTRVTRPGHTLDDVQGTVGTDRASQSTLEPGDEQACGIGGMVPVTLTGMVVVVAGLLS